MKLSIFNINHHMQIGQYCDMKSFGYEKVVTIDGLSFQTYEYINLNCEIFFKKFLKRFDQTRFECFLSVSFDIIFQADWKRCLSRDLTQVTLQLSKGQTVQIALRVFFPHRANGFIPGDPDTRLLYLIASQIYQLVYKSARYL